MTEDKRNNYPEEKTGQGRPKTEGKRRTTDKKTARTENGKRSGIPRNKAVLNRHRAHKTGHSRPRKPPPCNITAARQTKEDFHGLLMGTMIRDGPDKPATAKANTHTYRTNHRKTEQEGPSSHLVTVALGTVPKPDKKTGKERKNNQKDNKNIQKRGTENLIRGKSVAPDPNIYAKHAPNPAYIPYIIHSVSAKR